jgi:small subunit ribosomal protein S2
MQITLQDLLEAGAHFGHKTSRWNPQMSRYIYKIHKGVHIIDLPQTVSMLERAQKEVVEVVKNGGRVLFVGTKPQARELIKKAAERCGQYYIDHRWLGGTLTNWSTISESIKRLRDLEAKIASPEFFSYTKKEQQGFHHKLQRLNLFLGGIKNMGGLPDILFILDIKKEAIAVKEANQLGIPVVGVVDTNTDPRPIQFPIPGNDDALRAIQLYCDAFSDAVLAGLEEEMSLKGGDLGSTNDGMKNEDSLRKEIEAAAVHLAEKEAQSVSAAESVTE